MSFFWNKNTNAKNEKLRVNDFEFNTFLSPWYFKDNVPNFGKNYKWKYLQNQSITKLFCKNNCLGLVATYCYIQPVGEDHFLIWVRGTTKIELYRIEDLKPIYNADDIAKTLENNKEKYYFNCDSISHIEYFFDLYQTEIDFVFPEPFKKINEIIQVNDLNGMYRNNSEEINNTAIVILNPKKNEIKLYPQDWFNLDTSIDFGYQWITRAAKNETTEQIKIQGIRIDEYILDETNRHIKK